MPIAVEEEDLESLRRWGMGLERVLEACVFCRRDTSFWHCATNKPVCPKCAATHSVEELPALRASSPQRLCDFVPCPNPSACDA